MLESKRLDEVTYDDIREFVELGLEENARLDYKEEITKDLAKHVSAMANTEGGHIIIGVQEEDEDESGKKQQLNIPKPRDAIVGVEHEGKDLRAKCRDIVVARTNPRIAPEVKQIPLPDDGSRMVVVVRVEPSTNAPHELIQGQERRVFVRKHDSSVPATLDEMERMIECRNRLHEERFAGPPDFGRLLNGMRHPKTGADPSALSVVIRPLRALPARFEPGYDLDQELRELALSLELMERIEVSPIPQGAALSEYRNINPAEKVLVGRAEVAINDEMRLVRVMEREDRRPAIGHGRPRTLDFAEPAHFLQRAILFAAKAHARAGREVELEAYFELVGCTSWTVDISADTNARPPRGYKAEIFGRPLSYVPVGARPDAEELLTVVRELGRALGLSVPDARLRNYLLDLRLLGVEQLETGGGSGAVLDARPLQEQSPEDLLAFLEQGLGESLTLDYKRELGSGGKDKAELCKDVSALANSAGGMVVYGVDEEEPEKTPVLPPCGTSRYFGRQAVQEWVAQVLRSGVQPPLDVEIGVFDLEDGGDDPAEDGDKTGDEQTQCVMVVRVGASPAAPHMVTFREDNRYYGRFYRRSNYESRIAREYEVRREMLERARRIYEGVEGEIERRGYGDALSPAFGVNQYSRRLVTRYSRETEGGEADEERRFGSVVLAPTAPAAGTPRATQDRREWAEWLNPNARRYQPSPGSLFVPSGIPQPTLGGIACVNQYDEMDASGRQRIVKGVDSYLVVRFDGRIEFGFSSVARQHSSEDLGGPFMFKGGVLTGLTWQAVNFANDVRRRLELSSVPYLLLVNLKGTQGAILTGFARDWLNLDPAHSAWIDAEDAPRCLEPNVQVRQELSVQDFEEIAGRSQTDPPPQMRQIACEVSSAFGLKDPVLLPRERGDT